MVEVHNLNNTADRQPPKGYDTWRQWWEAKKKHKFGTCSCYDCANSAIVGAHVQKHSSSDRKWYIVPLCRECNGKKGEVIFRVREKDLEAINQ